MIGIIENLLTATEIEQINAILSESAFQNGILSAGLLARDVKNNEEIVADPSQLSSLNELVMKALVQHPEYRAICWPRHIAAPIYARYSKGMAYGEHVDDPVMGGQALYRADISFTVFLSPKDSYAGGELVISDTHENQHLKLDAGSVVFYPASSLHSVAEVTDGQRFVAIGWIQSTVRDPAKRQLLYELNQARELLIQQHPGSEACMKVCNSFNNLVRRWVDI